MQGSVTKADRESLWVLVDELLGKDRLILASNRGPMEYHVQQGGDIQPRRGSGGVVTALSGLTNNVDFTWIASAMGEGDRRAAEQNEGKAMPSPLPGQRVSVRFVTTEGVARPSWEGAEEGCDYRCEGLPNPPRAMY